MIKFIEALKAQIDPNARQRAKPIKLLAAPIKLIPEFCDREMQYKYLLSLVWNVSVWLDSSASDYEIELARKEAMKELARLIYGEIYSDLAQLRFFIKYGEDPEIIDGALNDIMNKIGMSL